MMNRFNYVMASKAICTAVLALVITGCSTPVYQASTGAGSGYGTTTGPGGLIRVTYHGNEAMTMHQTEIYTLYRCAEIAQREGSPYFAMYRTLAEALQDRRSTSVRPTTLLGTPYGQAYISPRGDAEPGLLSTAEVLARLAPSIRQETK